MEGLGESADSPVPSRSDTPSRNYSVRGFRVFGVLMIEMTEINAYNGLSDLGKSPKWLKKAGKATKPFYGVAAGAAGAALAPFTGGASLAAGALLASGIEKRAAEKAAKKDAKLAAQEASWEEPYTSMPVTAAASVQEGIPIWAWAAMGLGGATLLFAAAR